MYTVIVVAAVIALFLIAFGALCAIGDWAEKERRTFCLVLWYKNWSLKKGERNVALAKMQARTERRKAA